MSDSKYQKGKIYKITDCAYSKCYIGSTVETLANRMSKHRNSYRRYLGGEYRQHSSCCDLFDEFGMDNCKIELIEYYPCGTKAELNAREGHFIKSNECINKIVAGRTMKEHYNDNRERILEYAKNYKNENKERVKAFNSQKTQCECGCWISRRHMASHRRTPKHTTLMEQIKE